MLSSRTWVYNHDFALPCLSKHVLLRNGGLSNRCTKRTLERRFSLDSDNDLAKAFTMETPQIKSVTVYIVSSSICDEVMCKRKKIM